MFKYFFNSLFFVVLTLAAVAQPKSIDRIIGTVGDNIILQSELEAQHYQMLAQGYEMGDNGKCVVFEELLFQKLLLHQAKLDSVEVSEEQVEAELDRRFRYFAAQAGGIEQLEKYYGKSVIQLKEEFRDLIRDQILVQTMQQKVGADVKVTPSDVFDYFNRIPKDSLPFINAEVEVGRILKEPIISAEAKEAARKLAIEKRAEAVDGKDWCLLSIYSDDPGSSGKCGDLGFFKRGMMVSEFDAVAFRLKKEGEISEVFETEFGYHFMQLVERRGEEVHVRHILIKPKSSREDLNRAKTFLDSVYQLIMTDSLSFADAAEKFSDDEDSKGSDGLVINPNTGTTKFEMDDISQIDPTLFLSIDKMKEGDISKPTLSSTPDGQETYSIIYLKSRTEPHVANLKDDYQRIQNAASMEKQAKMINNWVQEKLETTYVNINADFHSCVFEHEWVKVEP